VCVCVCTYIYEGHPESKDCFAIKKNKQNNFKICIIIIIIIISSSSSSNSSSSSSSSTTITTTDPKLFLYIVASNFQELVTVCDNILYAFIIDLCCQSI